MKKLLISVVSVISMLALLSGCHEERQAQKPAPQFGVVQIAKLYQDSRIGKAGFDRLGELESKAQGVLKESLASLEKARSEQNEEEAARIEGRLQEHVAFMQEVIRRDQEHVGNVIQTVLKNVFDKYSQEHGLFGIFSAENMLSSSPEADVTDQVMAMIDKVEPAFGDLPSFDLPKLPEPANALPAEGGQVAPAEAEPAAKN
ncbi:MAG: OmpH family outer membrane protein [Mailhella sp.]|nr:OmpH family outer membrane protein [Mailhella sp.]